MDIIAMILVSYFNYKNAKEKGYKGSNYVFMTLGMMFGGELLGAVIGLITSIAAGLDPANVGILFAALIGIVFLAVGGVISHRVVKNLKPRGGYYPPQGYNQGFPGQGYNNQGFPGQGYYGQGYAGPQQHNQPQQFYPQFVPAYTKFEGSGVCDVCGKDVAAGEAFMVPVDIFYSSPKYKDWLIQNPVTQAGVMSLGGPDKYLAYMRSKDTTSHSTVCTSCVNLFK